MKWVQIIGEAYAHGFHTFRGTQCDVFKNPSRKEWREVQGKADMLRAFLVGPDILVWNTYAALHQMVREEMRLSADAIPLVIYGRPGGECLAQVTDNTRGTPWWHNGAIVEAIENHPFIARAFHDVTIGFYDEDIEGDWRELNERLRR